MNPKRKNRLILVLLILVGTGLAVTLGAMALKENIQLYLSPSEVKAGKAPANHTFRLAGLVANGSVKRGKEGLTTRFDVTDNVSTITVTYTGILPDLFREGQGIVAMGKLQNSTEQGLFVAEEVLAKHDENYMPPPVQDALDNAEEHAKNISKEKTKASGETAQ